MADIALSIMMLAVIGLVVGAALGWRRGMDRRRVVLMLVAALVVGANVLIWTLPNAAGDSLARQ